MAKAKYKEKEKDKDRPDRPRPRNDAYVVMLFITLFAIAAGCVLMYLDYDQYGSKAPDKSVAPTLPELGKGDTKAAGGAGGGGTTP
jgi:hypothetical protein